MANLTVRGAYRVLIEEGLVESVPKRGFYVRRPNVMTWRMNPGAGHARPAGELLDGWAADADAAGLARPAGHRRDRGRRRHGRRAAGGGAARPAGRLAGAGAPRGPLDQPGRAVTSRR